MGFMAGFGGAFSDSFGQARAASHAKEQDTFRYSMENAIKQRDKYDEWRREDSKAVKKAEWMVQQYGQPPEAIGAVYDMIQSGYDDKTLAEMLAGGKFNVNKATGKADAQTKAEAATQPEGPDAQMGAGAMGTPAGTPTAPDPQAPVAPVTPTAAPAAAPGSPQDDGGLLTKLFPGMKMKNRQARVQGRVAETMGVSPEALGDIQSGAAYQSPQMASNVTYERSPTTPEAGNLIEAQQALANAEAALKANPSDKRLQAEYQNAQRVYNATHTGTKITKMMDVGVENPTTLGLQKMVIDAPGGGKQVVDAKMVTNPDGTIGYLDENDQPIQGNARPQTPWEQEIAMKIMNDLAEPAKQIKEQSENLGQAYQYYGQGLKLVQDDERVLNQRTARATRWAIDFGKDVEAATTLVSDYLAGNSIGDLEAIETSAAAAEKAMNDPSLGPAKQLAAKYSLLEAYNAMAAYHVAASKGQAGAKLSEAERMMFQNLANNATSAPQYVELVAGVLGPDREAIDRKAKNLVSSHPMAQYMKKEFEYLPIEEITGLDTQLSGPGADLDRAISNRTMKPQTDRQDSLKAEGAEGATPAAPAVRAPSSAAIEHLKAHPELAPAFDQKYGEGASQQYLGGK